MNEKDSIRNQDAWMNILKWMGFGGILAIGSLLVFEIQEHIDVEVLKARMEWMSPRFDILWYGSTNHPIALPSNQVPK
jgi:hypothetical protein